MSELAGRLSVTTTLPASFAPPLVTVIVYVRLFPCVTGSGLSVFVIERSVSPTAAAAPPEYATSIATRIPSAMAAIPMSRGARQRESASLLRIWFFPPWLDWLPKEVAYPKKRPLKREGYG